MKILKKSTEKVTFFETMASEVHEQCCKAMTFKFYPKGHTIFEIGIIQLFLQTMKIRKILQNNKNLNIFLIKKAQLAQHSM